MLKEIPKATLFELLLCLIGKRKLFRVQGSSMWPLLQEGDVVVVCPLKHTKRDVQPQDIVIAQHPYKKSVILIKKVESISAEGVSLRGIYKRESQDVRDFGILDKDSITGRVLSKWC